MRVLAHLGYSAAFAVPAAVLTGEWPVLPVIVGLAAGILQLGRVIPGDSFRVKAMAWWLPPVSLGLVLWEIWRG